MKYSLKVFCFLIIFMKMSCTFKTEKIDNSVLCGYWYYFDEDSSYIEIYFNDSMVRENNMPHGLLPPKKYYIDKNKVFLIGDHVKTYYIKIKEIIDDSTLKILDSKKDAYIIKRTSVTHESIIFPSAPISEEIYDSLYDYFTGYYLRRALKYSNYPNKKDMFNDLN